MEQVNEKVIEEAIRLDWAGVVEPDTLSGGD
jgi:hypothetical protein